MPFTEKTITILRANGWSENRLLPTKEYEKKLIAAGYKPHTAALEFLSKFEGLTVSFESSKYDDKINNCHFDLDKSIAVADIDDIEDFGACIGAALCPIGEMNRKNSIVAIAEDGRVFGYYSPYISLLGNNYFDAINIICSEEKPICTLLYTGAKLIF